MTQPWDVRDKTCLVTGATSGHGLAVARLLARRGADVVLLGRDRAKCEAVRDSIAHETARTPGVVLCDLSSRREIDRAAAEWLDLARPLHLLVANAGLVTRDRRESVDGVELTMAVNYLAAFQLTLRLLPRLTESAPARIVVVASDAHRIASLDPDDLEQRRGWWWFMGAYAKSKLALLFFQRELARRLAGTRVTVNAVDPGPVASGIADHEPGLVAPVASWLLKRVFPSPERAARTAIHLAVAPELDGVSGTYWRFMERKEPRYAPDRPDVATRLWDWSVERTGADFPELPD
ncbi:MAG: SDR family NAD(P)-dependent oxidoreductase [Deltaproteobacteria bacterium]|nr:SDR family NAD(P)-dependent oxidoreductase [Deltaproteobacteria bacterium]